MKIFLKKLGFFFLYPIIIIAVFAFFYVKNDPFLDFKTYNDYSWKYNFQSLGDLSTKKLFHSSAKYNSFVFGSSRATSIYACYLQQKIPGSKFFHYANWRETIGGMYARMRMLDSLGYPLENVILYLDADNSFANYGKPKTNDHYLLNNESKYLYYYNHFRFMFTDANAMKILLGYSVGDEPNWTSDPVTNDPTHICTDSILKHYGDTDLERKDSLQIDSLKKDGTLYKRGNKQEYLEPQIYPYAEDILAKIKQLFVKHHTNYYVVITPLYDQMKFSPRDMQILKKVFDDRLYDFSGHNAITNNEYNYIEGVHFWPYVSKQIIDSIVKPGMVR